MPLQKKTDTKIKHDKPVSFRLSKDAVKNLHIIAEALNLTQAEVIEGLLADGLEKMERQYPNEIKAARKKHR